MVGRPRLGGRLALAAVCTLLARADRGRAPAMTTAARQGAGRRESSFLDAWAAARTGSSRIIHG